MANLKEQTKKAFPKVEKITRDAFLYMNSKANSPKDEFAQCSTCRMFVPTYEGGSCILHGSKVRVDDDDSCGLYAPWPYGTPNPKVVEDHCKELAKDLPGSVSPEESGLVSREVRCQNCEYFEEDTYHCHLYHILNHTFPEVFNLDHTVEPYGCCNANTEIPGNDKS